MPLFLFLINAAGIISAQTLNNPESESAGINQAEFQGYTADKKELAANLSGSCFKGMCCSSPSCSRWSDIDENGLCDRGE